MDLNELLHSHQVAAMKAGVAGDDSGRQGHFEKVALYAERIRALREQMHGSAPPPALIEGDTVIYGTYLPAPETTARKPEPVADWESEGGALAVPPAAIPAGAKERPSSVP